MTNVYYACPPTVLNWITSSSASTAYSTLQGLIWNSPPFSFSLTMFALACELSQLWLRGRVQPLLRASVYSKGDIEPLRRLGLYFEHLNKRTLCTPSLSRRLCRAPSDENLFFKNISGTKPWGCVFEPCPTSLVSAGTGGSNATEGNTVQVSEISFW